MIYILIFSQIILAHFVDSTNTELSLNNQNKVAMVNDYTLVNKVSPSNDIVSSTFGLQDFKQKEEKEKEKSVLNKWVSSFSSSFERKKDDTIFEKEITLLNRLIINATDGLLNMCDNMIAKTTSSLPLSYSFYTQFETEIRHIEELEGAGDLEGEAGLFGFFSSSSSSMKKKEDSKSLVKPLDKDNDDVRKQMYDYQLYRQALNNRQSFLNGLCFDTFGAPYTLYYNSVDNTLQFAFDLKQLQFYTIIVQNIIDNSYIRGLNKGFKQGYINDKNKGFKYDADLDFNKDKKDILVEKAKYILPVLHKLEQRLPSYLSNIAKRSLTTEEYFANLRHFWSDILDEANIAAHETPSKYELKLLEEKRAQLDLEEKERKARLEKEETDKRARLEREETDKRARLEREETDRRAKLTAERVIQEFKNKKLKKDAENYIREQEILEEDKRQNYSTTEWQQLGRQIKLQVSGFTGSLVSSVDGIIKVPVDYVLGFATDTIWEIGKVLGMVLILITIFNKIVSLIFYKPCLK
jgi:hypothetical protein